MNKSKIGLLIALVVMSVSINAQQAGQQAERAVTRSSSIGSSVDQSQSMYRILIQAALKSDWAKSRAFGANAGYLLTKNTFFEMEPDACVHLTMSGEANPNAQVNDEDGNSVMALKKQSSAVMNVKLPVLLALGEMAEKYFPDVQSRQLNFDQAVDFFTKKINAAGGLPMHWPDRIQIFFEPKNQEDNTSCGAANASVRIDLTVGIPHKTAYGLINHWRALSGQYQLAYDGSHLVMNKNGFEWISESVIDGKEMKISKSGSSSSSRSTGVKKSVAE